MEICIEQNNLKSFAQQIKEEVQPYFMLNHPFYQSWMQGTLTLEELQYYTVQYKPFVDMFPRLVSRIHSQCKDSQSRKELLQNLNEEEGFPNLDDHPTLWKYFAEGIDVAPLAFQNGPYNDAAIALEDLYWKNCSSSYAEGLAALYCYEHQIPEIAKAKIEGLKANYNIHDAKSLLFFSVHEEADKLHSESCEKLLNKIPVAEQEKALTSAKECAQSLWNFLTSCQLSKENGCKQ